MLIASGNKERCFHPVLYNVKRPWQWLASVWQWLALRTGIQPIKQVGIFASETDTENREPPLCAGRRLKKNEPDSPARFCVPGTYYVRDTASCVFRYTKYFR